MSVSCSDKIDILKNVLCEHFARYMQNYNELKNGPLKSDSVRSVTGYHSCKKTLNINVDGQNL